MLARVVLHRYWEEAAGLRSEFRRKPSRLNDSDAARSSEGRLGVKRGGGHINRKGCIEVSLNNSSNAMLQQKVSTES